MTLILFWHNLAMSYSDVLTFPNHHVGFGKEYGSWECPNASARSAMQVVAISITPTSRSSVVWCGLSASMALAGSIPAPGVVSPAPGTDGYGLVFSGITPPPLRIRGVDGQADSIPLDLDR